MSLKVNLRHLEEHGQQLTGQLPVEDLDLDVRDEMIKAEQPLEYNLHAEKLDQGLLLTGSLRLLLNCQCVRCLKPFQYKLDLNPWTCHVPLEGEEKAPIVNDCVDLTPYLREDILLEFPQHPLCDPECGGLLKKPAGKKNKPGSISETQGNQSAWSELNKLKF
jgi:uncharacterized protein